MERRRYRLLRIVANFIDALAIVRLYDSNDVTYCAHLRILVDATPELLLLHSGIRCIVPLHHMTFFAYTCLKSFSRVTL